MRYIDRLKAVGREANPFFVLMGIDVVSFGDGEVELSLVVRPDMLNGAGWMQGGLYAAVSDEAMALSLLTVLEADDRIATISETTAFLQGVRSGEIRAKGRVVRRGRQVAFTEGWVEDLKSGAVLSRTSASFSIIR